MEINIVINKKIDSSFRAKQRGSEVESFGEMFGSRAGMSFLELKLKIANQYIYFSRTDSIVAKLRSSSGVHDLGSEAPILKFRF